MIICHSHKFIFLKTRKTAGTSTEIALSKFCNLGDVITPIHPPDENLRKKLGYIGANNYEYLDPKTQKKKAFHAHVKAQRVKKIINPKIWNNYYKFCFERNPFDKVISYYYWQFKQNEISLRDYVMSEELKKLSDFDKYTINGRCVVDYIGQYENLVGDLNNICEQLNLPEIADLPKAKSGIRKDYREYKTVFSEEEIKRIAKVFSREIELLEYQF